MANFNPPSQLCENKTPAKYVSVCHLLQIACSKNKAKMFRLNINLEGSRDIVAPLDVKSAQTGNLEDCGRSFLCAHFYHNSCAKF